MLGKIKVKDINYLPFREDIHTSETLNNVTGSVNELVERYISGLSSLVDVHAPLITRSITPRPHAPWYSENLRAAKQLRRALERKWRKTNNDDDKARYREQFQLHNLFFYTIVFILYCCFIVKYTYK